MMQLTIKEVPPWEKKGRVVPLLGKRADTTPKLKKAWIEMRNVRMEAK